MCALLTHVSALHIKTILTSAAALGPSSEPYLSPSSSSPTCSSAQAARGHSDQESDASEVTWKSLGEGILAEGSSGGLWGSDFQGDVGIASDPVGGGPPMSVWGRGHVNAAPLRYIPSIAAAVVENVALVVYVVDVVVYVFDVVVVDVVVFAGEPFVAASIAVTPLFPPGGTWLAGRQGGGSGGGYGWVSPLMSPTEEEEGQTC